MSASVYGSLNRTGQARTGPDKTDCCCFKCCDLRSQTEQPSQDVKYRGRIESRE